MKAMNDAIYAAFSADATIAALGNTGVFDKLAPQGWRSPYIIFQRQPGFETHTYCRNSATTFEYLIKVILEGTSSVLANQINERVEALINHQSFPVTGFQPTNGFQKMNSVDFYELFKGVRFNHIGGIYRGIFVRV